MNDARLYNDSMSAPKSSGLLSMPGLFAPAPMPEQQSQLIELYLRQINNPQARPDARIYFESSGPLLRPESQVHDTASREIAEEVISLENLLNALEAYRNLGDDWDGDDARAISDSVISRSKELVQSIVSMVQSKQLTWRSLTIAPMSDGSVSISWQGAGNWLFLRVQPNRDRIACISEDEGSFEHPSYVSVDNALARVERLLKSHDL